MELNDKIARASLHVEVADRVREMIFDRSLPPGYRIDELELSARLGTSRTPLREALKVLANEGLVRLAPGRGAFVTELAREDVESLFPVLAMLEGRCASEAVRRQTPADVRRLKAIHQKMEEHVAAGDIEAYHRATDQLHERLHKMAANPWLLRAATDLRRFLRLARSMSQQHDGRVLHSLAEHRTLMKTIARGDAQSAEQVMTHHLVAQQKNWRQQGAGVTTAVAPGAPGATGAPAAPVARDVAEATVAAPQDVSSSQAQALGQQAAPARLLGEAESIGV